MLRRKTDIPNGYCFKYIWTCSKTSNRNASKLLCCYY